MSKNIRRKTAKDKTGIKTMIEKVLKKRIKVNSSSNLLNNRDKKQFLEKRRDQLSDLGFLGLELEKVKLGLDERYKQNIQEIKNNLKTLKNYFTSILDKMETDCIEKLRNEKQQNISNIFELEQKLKEVLSTYTKEKDMRKMKE